MWSNLRAHWMLSGSLFIFVLCHQWCLLAANHIHNHHHTHVGGGGGGDGTHSKWFRTEILDGNGLFILDWRKTTKDIIFRATVNTRGYIGIGFSYKSEKVADADIILAWVDDRTGEPNVLVSALTRLLLADLRASIDKIAIKVSHFRHCENFESCVLRMQLNNSCDY